jgi:hypothetical protein
MRGEAHVQRGTERRYYRCPTLGCRGRRYPADLVEGDILAAIADGVLPAAVIDAARAELRRRLQTPEVASAGRQRARLGSRLENLKKQHAWGDLSDAEYQAQRDVARAALAECRRRPDHHVRRPSGARLGIARRDRQRLPGAAGGALPDRGPAGGRPRPPDRGDRVDAADAAVPRSEKTKGVPPRGFEPLISTLKGWRPRPLDDGGERPRRADRPGASGRRV